MRSVLVRKEVRALLPYWAATMVLIAAPYAFASDGPELSWLAYCFGCALLGGIPFGHELQHGTLPLLLSQPISRSAIWWSKMLPLGIALLSCTAVLAAGSSIWDATIMIGGVRVHFLRMVAPCVFCGAPLLTLVTRSALGGAILSLSVPGFVLTLLMIADFVFPEFDPSAVSSTLFFLYCPIALWLSWLRWQAQQSRHESPAVIAAWPSSAPRGPLAALLTKELRLQYGTFAMVVPLWALFFLGGVLSHEREGDWPAIASVITVIDLLVLPLIACAIAFGEERSLGLADWQLSLPPSARLQWLAKMLVTLPITLLLGLAVPLLVRRPALTSDTLLLLLVGHLLLTHLAIYAASITNGTMPAVLLALGFWCAAGIALLYGGLLERLGDHTLAAMTALMLALHAFAFTNYRRSDRRPRRLGLQGVALSAVVAIALAIS